MPPQPLSKKQVERWQLDRFIEAFHSFPRGSIEESEEPDFIVDSTERLIGIELTDLYWESPEAGVPQQAQESLRFRIVQAAQSLYGARGLPNLHVSIHFNPSYIPKKRDVQRLAAAIDKLVSNNVPAPGQSYNESYDWENRGYFPEEIYQVGSWNLPGAQGPFFTSPSAAFVPTLESDDIVRALSSKESKLSRYRLRCKEVWLLINFDGGQLSTFFEHDEKVVQQSYLSGFDRVFLLRHVGNKLHELKLLPAAA